METGTENIQVELLQKERSELGRIFLSYYDVVQVTDNFHIYAIDCRPERTLDDIINRIDVLMKNAALKEKEVIQFPMIFKETVLKNKNLYKNIVPTINDLYKTNFITGKRKEESRLVPGYYHNISWVGIILSIKLKDQEIIPGVFDYNFKTIKSFLEAFVPGSDSAFLAKINSIKSDLHPDTRIELEQFFAAAKKIRPEMMSKYTLLEGEIMKQYSYVADDVMDYIKANGKENNNNKL